MWLMLGVSRPILTPKTVLPLFFIIGIIFAPIGGLLLYASAKVSKMPDLWLCNGSLSVRSADIGIGGRNRD